MLISAKLKVYGHIAFNTCILCFVHCQIGMFRTNLGAFLPKTAKKAGTKGRPDKKAGSKGDAPAADKC